VIDRAEITGVILCGGEARRMGGREKPLELAGGVSLVTHVRARLAPQVCRIVISANRHVDVYSQWGDMVVVDEQAGLGPLGGLLSALGRIETPYTFCCPGDAPLLSTALVAKLATGLLDASADLAFPHDGERRQPLFMLLRTNLRSALRTFLQGTGRAVHPWIETQRSIQVDAPFDRESFVNVNAEADLLRLDRFLAPAGTRA
jgi:molybdopterin-guanine dinucleotide biosynthesis protein A